MVLISGNELTLHDVVKIAEGGEEVRITEDCLVRCRESFDFLSSATKDKVIYGINTGLGPQAQYYIAPEEHLELQYNLVRSHASGTGQPLDELSCRALMVARLNSLAIGYSGIHPDLLTVLAAFLNQRIHPYIPEHGGVGASGDLVQLAHLALNLIGEGEVLCEGKRIPAAEVLVEKSITPLQIKGREGLAILNGTSAMTGIGLLNILRAQRLLSLSTAVSSVLNDLMASYNDHFSEKLNAVKRHPGQQYIAAEMRKYLAGSQLTRERSIHVKQENQQDVPFDEKVQEYYSLRCVPQILGPVHDALTAAETVLLNELNSVNDNPVMDITAGTALHGGNFHGDYVSFEMDKLRMGITKLSILTERQLNYLAADYLNGKFPKFLAGGKRGLHFGIQGMQFTATSTVAENQMLSNPLYVHSIPTNADNQDVVSMGTNAALATSRVISNSFQVMSIMAVALVKAFRIFDDKDQMAPGTRNFIAAIESAVSVPDDDQPIYPVLEQLAHAFASGQILNPHPHE